MTQGDTDGLGEAWRKAIEGFKALNVALRAKKESSVSRIVLTVTEPSTPQFSTSYTCENGHTEVVTNGGGVEHLLTCKACGAGIVKVSTTSAKFTDYELKNTSFVEIDNIDL